ncbi:universal stress protein [Lewinella sp. IMCC34191]|uniref:universal stress protein n=1 Tax=Lewinella sp. IMCC34191 TaxID=2259172 RepID=UPI000E227FD1|nr:universal stress protein [Lewinella sp. IMCC34191]
MTHILVPVDFSATSAAALRFAAYLAEGMDFDLEVIHVFDALVSATQTLSVPVREREQHRLEAELRSFAHKHTDPVMAVYQGRLETLPEVRCRAVEGVPAATLLGLSERSDTALVVMGGVGSGQGLRPPGIFGSVARNLATRGGCPVILIPSGYGDPVVDRLAVAFEEPADLRTFKPLLRRLIRGLHPSVRYVHVRDRDAALERKRAEDFVLVSFGPDFPSYTYAFDELPPGNVVDSLVSYTGERQIDLLVVGRKRRPFFNRLFHTDHLSPVVRKSTLPLLVIPFTTDEADDTDHSER